MYVFAKSQQAFIDSEIPKSVSPSEKLQVLSYDKSEPICVYLLSSFFGFLILSEHYGVSLPEKKMQLYLEAHGLQGE